MTRKLIDDAIRTFLAQPLAIDPRHVELVLANIRAEDPALLLGSDSVNRADSDFWGSPMARWYRPYRVKDGVLMVPVQGTLTNQHHYQIGRYQTGYRYVEEAVRRGVNDPQVRAIVLDVNSPGGTAAGAFPASDAIFALRQQTSKPITAYTDGLMCSGAYAIGSAADQVVGGRDAEIGSVGVVRMHADVSGLLDNMGIDISFIHAGAHKVDGNPFQPLPDDVRTRFQGEVDKTHDLFTSTVARNRAIGQDEVVATEALTYDAEDAVSVRFCDRIEERRSFDEAQAAQVSGGAISMTQQTGSADQPSQGQEGAATETAAADAVKAERARTTKVLGHDAYKGREELAATLLDTDMSADQIITALEKAPKPGGASAGRSHFQEHMDREGGAGTEAGDAAEAEQVEAQYGAPAKSVRILQSYQKASGWDFRKTDAFKGAAA